MVEPGLIVYMPGLMLAPGGGTPQLPLISGPLGPSLSVNGTGIGTDWPHAYRISKSHGGLLSEFIGSHTRYDPLGR